MDPRTRSSQKQTAAQRERITPAGSQAGSVTGPSVARSQVTASSQQLRVSQNVSRLRVSQTSSQFQPPSRRSSQASQVSQSQQQQQSRPARTPPGSEIRSSRTAPGAEMAYKTKRYTAASAASGASGARSTDNLQMQVLVEAYRPRSQLSGSQSARSLASVPMGGSVGASARPSSARGSNRDIVSDSAPVAGMTWGHLTRQFGNGTGKKAFEQKPGLKLDEHLHAETSEDNLFSKGKKMFLGQPCSGSHMHGMVPETDSIHAPGSFGHSKHRQTRDGLPGCIGFGVKKFPNTTTDAGHVARLFTPVEGGPGKDEQGTGLICGGTIHDVGHGKSYKRPSVIVTRVDAPIMPKHLGDRQGWEKPGRMSPDTAKFAEYRTAGLTTKAIMMQDFSRDPSRQGTHQDSRTRSKDGKRDAELFCPFAYRML